MNMNLNAGRKKALLYGCALTVLLSLTASANATTWYVGPTRTYKTPCAVSTLVANGDTVYIDYSPSNAPGVGYYDDSCVWRANNLSLIGVLDSNGKRPVLNAAGLTDTATTGHIAFHQGIWLIFGSNATVENMEFENAGVSSDDGGNGAGIRSSGVNLSVINSYFHDNQDGILESNIAGSNIVIENSEFYKNGNDDPNSSGYGQTHNLYIGHCASLTFVDSYSHAANIGHVLKSRAAVNYILYSKLTQENGDQSSIEIDLPNGGTSYVIGNELQKGPNEGNDHFVSYREEGPNPNNPGQDLYVVNNTFVNQLGDNATYVTDRATTVGALLENNIFYGGGTITDQTTPTPTEITNYSVSNDPSMFVNIDKLKYDLTASAGSPPIDSGTTPGLSTEGYALTPQFQYIQHGDAAGNFECQQARTTVNGIIDIGAYEYGNDGRVTCPAK